MAGTDVEDATIRITEGPGEVQIAIAGAISEHMRTPEVDVRGRRVVFDVHGVERINSMGVRSWIDMMDSLGAQTQDIVLQRVPPVLVSQASMISNFLGRARIESFMSPWVCPSCDTNHDQLHRFTDELPATLPCPRCKSAMELDWDREAYLSFRA